jgi:hypothetical protein
MASPERKKTLAHTLPHTLPQLGPAQATQSFLELPIISLISLSDFPISFKNLTT